MGIGAIGSALGGIGSIAGAANSIFGGSGSGSGGFYGGTTPPPVYIPQGQASADQLYQQAMANAAGYAQGAQGYVGNIQANPYAPQAQTTANQASAYGTGTLAPMQQGGAASLYGAGNTVLNTAFDPQLALYNQQAQRTQDQANAINAMYGLSSSPYGAGVANQAMTNFNIDWQNQQLQRQIQGVQGAGKAYSGASDLGGTAGQTIAGYGALPYQTYLGQQTTPLSAISTAQGLDSNAMNALAAYLRLGQSATSVGQTGAGINFDQNQALGQGIGQGLSGIGQFTSGLSTLFGGNSSPSFGNNYANTVDTLNAANYYGPTDASGALLYG